MYYMKMRSTQVHSRLGKMVQGQIVPMDQAMAARFLRARAAVQVTSGEYDEQNQRKRTQVSARQDAFFRLNQQPALWDASTYRDVLTSSEEGLRRAYDAGVPLENLHYLRDPAGNPLDQDADIEDILAARANLQPMIMTGRQYEVQGGPQPLTPKYRESARPVQQPFAPPRNPGSEREQRAQRRKRTLHGDPNEPELVGTPVGPQPPAPPLNADQIANS